jgi:hypothetical protein
MTSRDMSRKRNDKRVGFGTLTSRSIQKNDSIGKVSSRQEEFNGFTKIPGI